MKILFIAFIAMMLGFTGCKNCSFEPTLSMNLNLYNRGGTVAADSQARSGGARGIDAEISNAGGGLTIPQSAIDSNLQWLVGGELYPTNTLLINHKVP